MSLLAKPKLLPFFSDVLKGLVATEPYSDTSAIQNVPILCRFLSIDPEVVISDKFHSIPCLLSSHALFKVSKKIPEKTALKGEFVLIQEYKLSVLFNKESMEGELQLRVEKFFCQNLRPYFPEDVAYNVPKLSMVPEIKERIEMMRVKHLRTLMQPLSEKTCFDSIEKLLSKSSEQKFGLIREKQAADVCGKSQGIAEANVQEETLGSIMNRRNKMKLLRKKRLLPDNSTAPITPKKTKLT
eukprot:TRINITY_DN13107_c0_g1_i3.p1 TRINITY_DN13107_c0_g1~~TRINITY_DN13107_c0_g1_i3.p1  ORF type:complete len:241 (-),score=46.66 TRINITY_DN13107_c0_g1_i3:145-867(-)